MKAITLTAPWGTLVAIGAKRMETRAWSTPYRGPLAIHQAKGLNGLRLPGEAWVPKWELDQRLVQLCDRDPFFTALRPHLSGYTAKERASDLPRGAIVSLAKLIDCVPTRDIDIAAKVSGSGDMTAAQTEQLVQQERAFGDFTPGRYAWVLENVLNLHDGVACKGGRGLWDVPAAIVDELTSYDDVDGIYE